MNLQKKSDEDITELFGNYRELREVEQLYEAAMKQVKTKIEVLSSEFAVHYDRNPIHHVESRLKSPLSILNKLKSKGCEISIESAKKNLNDIAGIRIICGYIDDVYAVAEMLLRQSDIKLIKKQDYIKEPNFNGYRSLHLDIEVPVYLSDSTEYVIAEVQIRTVAMDFWASLEHELRYKAQKNVPEHICQAMKKSADEIARIDANMQDIYKEIQQIQ